MALGKTWWTGKLPFKWRLLPVLAFGIPLVAIAFVQYRWLEEIRTRSRLIESQRNREIAIGAIALLEEEITRARLEFLPAIVHADVLNLRRSRLARSFDSAQYPYVELFFVWSAPDPPEGTLFYDPKDRSFGQKPELVSRFPADVWSINPLSRRWAEFRATGVGPQLQVVVHRIMEPEGTRQTGVVGFTVNLSDFARSYLPAFHRERIESLLAQHGEFDPIPIAFLDEFGDCRFGVPRCAQVDTSSPGVEFPVSFGVVSEGAGQAPRAPRWRLVVGDSADGIEEVLRHGALGNLAIVGAGILVLALGAALIARSSRREAELSDLKSRFISGISHDLKTPLALIRLYSEMLELGRVPDAERKDFYGRLRQQAEALGDMLEQILDFSRLEAEQRPGRMQACAPEEIIEEAVDMLTGSGTMPRNVSLTVESGLPQLTCDRHGLVRAVYNLLDNAAKYSHPDQPIAVHAARRNGTLAVDVVDRGAGIPAEEIPHIFDRFYRGRLANTMAVKGAGLGLSIAETTVKAHRGKIEVASAPGEGSRFTILLPLENVEGPR